MIRFLFRFFSFPFPFYLLYDKSRPKKENHQILIRINREIPFPSSFLLKLFCLRTSDFPPAFLAKPKSCLFELYYECCDSSDCVMIQTALRYVPKRSLNFSGFSFRLCPLCLKPISFSPSAIPVSLKFSSLLLRFFRKFFTLSISFHVERRDFFRSGIFLFDEPLGSSLSGISVSCLSLLSFQNLHLLVSKIPFARFFFIQL